MVPPEYSNYFVTMATVSATLFGLIFLVVSITPESIAGEGAPLVRQLQALAAYLALSNPLIIALFALLPHQEIGPAVVAVGSAGLLNMLVMALLLFRDSGEQRFSLRNSLFIVVGLVLYGFEVENGVRLLQRPSDSSALYTLGTVLIFILVFGVARAWELVGGRAFHIRDWLSLSNATSRRDTPMEEDKEQTKKKVRPRTK
jgi:hypothetical protein